MAILARPSSTMTPALGPLQYAVPGGQFSSGGTSVVNSIPRAPSGRGPRYALTFGISLPRAGNPHSSPLETCSDATESVCVGVARRW